MPKIETKVTEYICDLCGSTFDGSRTLETNVEYFMDTVTRFKIWYSAVMPYSNGDGLVCKNCAKKHLQEIIEKL